MSSGLAAGLSSLGDAFAAIMQWIGDFITTIVNTPLLLVGLALMVASAVVTIAYKAVKGRG